MKLGLFIFLNDEAIAPVELARAAEARGFESLFLPEHTHIPSQRTTPYIEGGELPDEYRRTFDPFVTLGAMAAVTERLKLGTSVCLVVQRDPIVLAKEVATLDRLSGGRVLFGVGAGWNAEEMRNHGTDPQRRMTVLRERIEAMKVIWRDDVASYDGEFVSFEQIWSWPKPLQQPHPPILVGGNVESTLRRVVAFGDEWMPSDRRDNAALARGVERLQELASEAGRERIPVSLFAARARAADIEAYAELGVDRCLFWLPPAGRDDVLPRLERYAKLVEAYAEVQQ
jgi:probable F420-dependent oxidoreductase